jgi:archaea-specific DNA-binding protein
MSKENIPNENTSKDSDNSVFIGKRPTMNYVMAAMMLLNEGKNCIIKARGRSISHAVDVAEILKKKFVKAARYVDIRLTTEQLTNSDNKVSNVSSIEIEIAPK